MFKYLVFLSLIAIAVGEAVPVPLPESTGGQVPIITQDSQVNPDGNFKFSYETADGTKVEQIGEPKVLDKDVVVENVHGSYLYPDALGKTHAVSYVANENGYFPTGDDIAPAILKNLEYIASHPHPIETEQKTN